jgi:hypothetical protein
MWLGFPVRGAMWKDKEKALQFRKVIVTGRLDEFSEGDTVPSKGDLDV